MKEFKKLKEITLSDSEKRSLFERISTSIKKESSDTKLKYSTPSPFFRFSFLLESRYVKVGILAGLILSLTSATAFASLDTLPGDLLYGVKTNVVEKIPAVFHRSAESKAKDNSRKIERRVDEFEKLAEKGRLNKKNTKKLEKDIQKNLGDFDENIREIKNKKAELRKENYEKEFLETELESKLQRHSEKIEKIREQIKKEENSYESDSTKDALESVLERARGESGIDEEEEN